MWWGHSSTQHLGCLYLSTLLCQSPVSSIFTPLLCLLLSLQLHYCPCSFAAAAAAKSLQSCPTLCDPIDGSPPGSPIPGILQARTLEWVAISFSNVWKWKVKVKSLSCVRLLATPWTAALYFIIVELWFYKSRAHDHFVPQYMPSDSSHAVLLLR